MTDYSAFYAVEARAAEVFCEQAIVTPFDRGKLSVIVTPQQKFESLAKLTNGEWQRVDGSSGVEVFRRISK